MTVLMEWLLTLVLAVTQPVRLLAEVVVCVQACGNEGSRGSRSARYYEVVVKTVPAFESGQTH